MKIKSILFILFCLTFCFNVSAQKDISIDFYNKGVKEFQSKNFAAADSLFTLSLNKKTHADTYFSRAAVRLKLNDKKGYCVDLYSASVLNDKEAESIYWKDCAKKEIKYFDKNDSMCNEDNFYYKETVITEYYENLIKYSKEDLDKKLIESYEVSNSDTIFIFRKNTIMPTFKGGDRALFAYLGKTIQYPQIAKENGYSGTVFIQFKISEIGKVHEAKVVRSVNQEIDAEALRVIQSMPDWIPAIYNGNNVECERITIPIKFVLR